MYHELRERLRATRESTYVMVRKKGEGLEPGNQVYLKKSSQCFLKSETSELRIQLLSAVAAHFVQAQSYTRFCCINKSFFDPSTHPGMKRSDSTPTSCHVKHVLLADDACSRATYTGGRL
mmetsp:Transcript_18231/g.45133  ORF Transcript_18231/g.45133 Transcript_18231/m.45133 type:complete len:120 (-) Transcript_18231:788-1147(-)